MSNPESPGFEPASEKSEDTDEESKIGQPTDRPSEIIGYPIDAEQIAQDQAVEAAAIEKIRAELGLETQPKPESEKPLQISQISPDDPESIAAYYRFEVDNGFSTINPSTTFEKMVSFRQRQIRENKLQVMAGKEGDQVIATSVIILENGAMGKEIKEDEAWAAGTLVLPGKRGGGIGEKMSQEQDRVAREAGKKSILTTINNRNYPSMRLRMKVGYQLEGLDQREDETNYRYRKDLTQESSQTVNWAQEATSGRLKAISGEITDNAPEQILIDPEDDKKVKTALANGYRGVHLLRPEDFEEPGAIAKNQIVFTREKKTE